MTFPLIFLALASIFAGYIPFSEFVSSDLKPFETHIEWMPVASLSIFVGLAGIFIAMIMYRKENNLAERLRTSFKFFYRWTYNKFYIDELYLFITKSIIFKRVCQPIAWFDRHVIDGTMNGIAWTTVKTSNSIKGLQSGQLQKYGFIFISGVLMLVLVFIYLWK
jgi:NADH-quinone oxidoreductase subunit L